MFLSLFVMIIITKLQLYLSTVKYEGRLAKYINVSDWVNNEWISPSKGSRPLKILSHPESDDEYFFKQSTIKYPAEFWSEVIASEIGRAAGIDVLPYDIASYNGVLGCLSKSMTPNPLSQLYHGVDVLRDYISDFEITAKPVHSFQQLMTLCENNPEFTLFKRNFIDMIIFDALIGNTDRHTENWAFLQRLTVEPEEAIQNLVIEPVKKDLHYYFSRLINRPLNHRLKGDINLHIKKDIIFSPIYDSGSCLGRELTEEKMKQLAVDEKMVASYLNKSNQEIRWNGQKMNCFDIIRNILEIEAVLVKEAMQSLCTNLDEKKIVQIVDGIDQDIIGKVDETFLSLQRKSLIKVLLLARFERLKGNLSVS